MQQRLVTVASWILKGVPRAKAVGAAMQEWQVRRRTAQDYVQRALAHLKSEAAQQDGAFMLQLSQLQREQLYEHLATQLERVQLDPEATVRIVMGMARLLDGRERTAMRLQALEQAAAKATKQRTKAAGNASLHRAQDMLQGILATTPSCHPSPPTPAAVPPPKDVPGTSPAQPSDRPDITNPMHEHRGSPRDKSSTAQLAVESERKARGGRRMRPQLPDTPNRASCATEISRVDNKPPGRAPPKGVCC
jgi:hypothetical protein